MLFFLVLTLAFSGITLANTGGRAPDAMELPNLTVSAYSLLPHDPVKKCEKGTYISASLTPFLEACKNHGIPARFCENLSHPNRAKDSVGEFYCTYGEDKPHILIPPTQSVWTHAFEATKLLQSVVEKDNICVKEIVNWWRPEPYNANVDGSGKRHPWATAIDIQFCTRKEAKAASKGFCDLWLKGKVASVGSYENGDKLHIGMPPEDQNTWGQYACTGTPEVLTATGPVIPPYSGGRANE